MPFLLLSSNSNFARDNTTRTLIQGVLQKPVLRNDLFAKLAAMGTVVPDKKPLITSTAEDTETAPPPTKPEQILQPCSQASDQADVSPSTSKTSETETSTSVAIEPETLDPVPVSSTPRLMRILAAEDNKTNQLVFRKMVKDLNIDIRFANNGIEAVEAYSDFSPDLIFMDISMPKMDGKQATGEIRKIEKTSGRHVPIVALTAHAMNGDSEGILAAGLDFYLTKPLRKAVIHEQIEQHVPGETQSVLP